MVTIQGNRTRDVHGDPLGCTGFGMPMARAYRLISFRVYWVRGARGQGIPPHITPSRNFFPHQWIFPETGNKLIELHNGFPENLEKGCLAFFITPLKPTKCPRKSRNRFFAFF